MQSKTCKLDVLAHLPVSLRTIVLTVGQSQYIMDPTHIASHTLVLLFKKTKQFRVDIKVVEEANYHPIVMNRSLPSEVWLGGRSFLLQAWW